jgi:hypothetical protein
VILLCATAATIVHGMNNINTNSVYPLTLMFHSETAAQTSIFYIGVYIKHCQANLILVHTEVTQPLLYT